MRSALVWRARVFIGGHLVKRLKAENVWVRGGDRKHHEYNYRVLKLFLDRATDAFEYGPPRRMPSHAHELRNDLHCSFSFDHCLIPH